MALVIGNSAYTAVQPLDNPKNDASDVATALEGLGFNVIRGIDVDQSKMADLVERFTTAASDADVSLFFYAGHGFQVDASNYLVPTDAVIQSKEDITQRTIKLDDITGALEGGDGIHLVFLDACRNNPLGNASGELGRAVQDGLARIGNAAGFLFAFATQPDNVAYDGAGRNSPFTQALLGHINTPAQDVASMMIEVRKDVLAATGGKQVPWENSSLTREFQFLPGSNSASPETMLWQVAAKARDPALMRIYLDRYPEGAHVTDVREFLDHATFAALDTDSDTAIRNLPEQSQATILEDSLWELAKRTRLPSLVEVYISQNPTGRYAAEAKLLLEDLPRADAPDASPALLCEKLATHPRDATANTSGVPLAALARDADIAIRACSEAASARPEAPHYKALLARAKAAAGQRDEAIALYRDAAGQGDLRAMVSLGLITETGDGVPRDIPAAVALYERAAQGGSPDGAINLAVALFQGTGVQRDVDRAVGLLRQASDAGSAIATFNLGVLAQDGVTGTPEEALGFFTKAAGLGEARGYVAAAILLDEGRGVARDPEAAADMLLQGAAADTGEAVNQMTVKAANWSADTLRAVQAELQRVGYYKGTLDGVSGPQLKTALQQWRNGGLLDALSGG